MGTVQSAVSQIIIIFDNMGYLTDINYSLTSYSEPDFSTYFWLASILSLLSSDVPENVQYFNCELVGNISPGK